MLASVLWNEDVGVFRCAFAIAGVNWPHSYLPSLQQFMRDCTSMDAFVLRKNQMHRIMGCVKAAFMFCLQRENPCCSDDRGKAMPNTENGDVHRPMIAPAGTHLPRRRIRIPGITDEEPGLHSVAVALWSGCSIHSAPVFILPLRLDRMRRFSFGLSAHVYSGTGGLCPHGDCLPVLQLLADLGILSLDRKM